MKIKFHPIYRHILTALPCAALLALLVSCSSPAGDAEKPSSPETDGQTASLPGTSEPQTPSPADTEAPDVLPNVGGTFPPSAAASFQSVLCSNGEFIHVSEQGQETLTLEKVNNLFPQYKGITAEITNFSIVDMDGDGENEIILWIWFHENAYAHNYYEPEILHFHEGTVYGYGTGKDLVYDWYKDLKMDGTISFHHLGADSCGKLAFSENEYTFHEIYREESKETAYDTWKKQYWIEGRSCSEEEYHRAADSRPYAEPVKWHEFTPARVAAALEGRDPSILSPEEDAEPSPENGGQTASLPGISEAPAPSPAGGVPSETIPADDKVPDASPDSASGTFPPSVAECLRSVLCNNGEFIHVSERGQETLTLEKVNNLFPQYENITAEITDFSIVDMDGDGENEIILWIWFRERTYEHNYFEPEILHCHEGTVYGYGTSEDLIYDWYKNLHPDGTFSFYHLSTDHCGRLVFSANECTFHEIYRGERKHVSFDVWEYQYWFEGRSCSKEEYHKAMADRRYVQSVKWHEFTPAKVTAALEGRDPSVLSFEEEMEHPCFSPKESFRAILSDSGNFIHGNIQNKELLTIKRLEALLTDGYFQTDVPFAIADMDGDGQNDIILSTSRGYEILRYQNGHVYGSHITARGFLSPKTDGTFALSGGAGHRRIGRFDFSEDNTYDIDTLYECNNVYDFDNKTSTMYYFAGGEPCSEEEYNDAQNRQNEKPDLEWYDLTPENINSVLENYF